LEKELIDRLKELLDAGPFEAFRIVVTSGGAYEVTSPYQVAVGETRLDYFFPHSDRSAMLRLNQIVAFETLEEMKQ
jgi:hypothetical protein